MTPVAFPPPSQPPDAGPPSSVRRSSAAAAADAPARAALDAFARENFERASFWARRLRVPVQDIEEMVQETFLALWKGRHGAPAPEVWLSWLYTVLENKNVGRRRAHARWKKHEPLLSNRLALQAGDNWVSGETLSFDGP